MFYVECLPCRVGVEVRTQAPDPALLYLTHSLQDTGTEKRVFFGIFGLTTRVALRIRSFWEELY